MASKFMSKAEAKNGTINDFDKELKVDRNWNPPPRRDATTKS